MADRFPKRIETDRLALDPLDREHVDPRSYYRICSSDAAIGEVTEFLQWSPHATLAETVSVLESAERRRDERETVEYVIRPSDRADEDDAGIAGTVGLNVEWTRRLGTYGIWLRKPYWGRGYFEECGVALAELAFDRLDLDRFEILVRDDNERSMRASAKFVDRVGGRHESRLRNYWTSSTADRPRDAHRYTVVAEEFTETTAVSSRRQ